MSDAKKTRTDGTNPLFGQSFGDVLRFLRKRVHLTQDELGRTVGYSREQIARLENGSRLPDLAVMAALFIPALDIQHQPELAQQLLKLAGQTRTLSSETQRITVTHTTQTKTQRVMNIVGQQTDSSYTLPLPIFPLIGRAAEIDSLYNLLVGDARLITLVGTPGIGKTRLALEVAHTLKDIFAQGACFVALDSVQNSEDVPSAIAAALGITPTADQAVETLILSHLISQEVLLVIDNCEHVLEAAILFSKWLTAAPKLKLLCTSRIALDLYGEYEWEVYPLGLPDLANLPDLEELNKISAVQLFVARIHTVEPTFVLNLDNAMSIAALCVALDGLPLALELAAARAREINPSQVLRQIVGLRSRAQVSSTLLKQTKRNIADRHQTLHNAIAWSYDLLSQNQQEAFMRLGVFVGGCTLQAAQTVCDTNLQTLQVLAAASLIRLEIDSSNGRVTMLETLRSFALDRLIDAQMLETYQHIHTVYYADYAQTVFKEIRGEQQQYWLSQTRLDHDNFRSALRFALQLDDPDLAITLAGGLWWFWYRQGFLLEGKQWLDKSLRHPAKYTLAETQKRRRAIALNGAGAMACELCDYSAAMAYHEEGLALRHEINDEEGVATVLHNMALVARSRGEYRRAIDLLEESLAMEEKRGEDANQIMTYANIGITAGEMNNLELAQSWLERALEKVTSIEHPWETAFIAVNLAQILFWKNDIEQAEILALQSLQLFEELGDLLYLPEAQLILAQIAIECGNFSQTQILCEKVLQYYQELNDEHGISNVLHVLAWSSLIGQKTREGASQAAKLFSDSVDLRKNNNRALSPAEHSRNQLFLNALDLQLKLHSE